MRQRPAPSSFGISRPCHPACRRRGGDLRLYGGMVVARASDAGQDGRGLQAAGGRAARPSQELRKGICFTGVFEANGAGSALSRAEVLAAGQYPIVGRFNLGTPNPDAPDATVRVRGMGLRIMPPSGQEWRAAMINAPVFAVSPRLQDLGELLKAAGSKEPDAMKNFVGAHPEFGAFGEWATKGPWTGSFAEEHYNGLNSFIFTDALGADHPGALGHGAGGTSPGTLLHLADLAPRAAPTFSSRRSPNGSQADRSAGP